MNHQSQQGNDDKKKEQKRVVNWRYGVVLCGFTAFAALLLLQEHRAHMGWVLYLIFILCPLMLFFIYREQRSLDKLIDKKSKDNKENKHES